MMKKAVFLSLIALFCAAPLTYAQELPKIAVYVTGNVHENEKKALGTRMLASLIKSGSYVGIERSNSFLEEINKEHIKQRSGAIDDSQISRLGKQFGVKYICIADINPAFGSFQVSARIVDVETAVVVSIGETFSPLRLVDDFKRASDEVVSNMLDGYITPTSKPMPVPKPAPQPVAPKPAAASDDAFYEFYSKPAAKIPPPATVAITETPEPKPEAAPVPVQKFTFIDSRDKKTYKAITIDGKTWMAENLNYKTKYSWCYDGNSANCEKYGSLYTWDAAKNACPAGWHLPSRQEWGMLVDIAGGYDSANKLKAKSPYWSGRGTDDYGSSALPGGLRTLRTTGGNFRDLGSWGFWWTATERDASYAYSRDITGYAYVGKGNIFKGLGLSVRCVKD